MKKATLILMLIALLAGCKQNEPKMGNNERATAEQTTVSDPSSIYVYYFHGKQRCKTCIAVGDIAQTVAQEYAGKDKVQFLEIDISDKANESLAEKYEVSWNALIIAKGEDFVDITEHAFATAIDNPQSLENLIKEEINKRITN
ncbi:MAG: nitrophenyl compound nitroreductase subunit ArsF family protein [Bacteroidales bacterium]|nr:nitrophenyl compound nitroreductase subunit ArsF family protein [Bacteroidales bacterium]